MAQLEFSGDLTKAAFPFLLSSMPRTAILKEGQSGGRISQGESTSPVVETPQGMYMENCIPTKQGVQSIGYTEIVPAISDVFTNRIPIRASDGKKYQLAIAEDGSTYLLDLEGTLVWTSIALPAGFVWDDATMVTTAYVQGDTYIYLSNKGCIKLDLSSGTFPYALVEVTLTGVDKTLIKGVAGAANYLVLCDDLVVYWSSSDDVTDFTPSLTTGADSTQISDLRGTITFIASVPQGFLIYATDNVVSATFTNNIRFPWNFREVPGSAGVVDPEQVSFEENFAEHMAWTNSGLLKLNRVEATLEFPEVTDFITGRRYETFDWTTGQVIKTLLDTNLLIKVTIVSSRYLLISYGAVALTNALLYDYGLKRWGHLKIDHVDAFEYAASSWKGPKIWKQLQGLTWLSLHTVTWKSLRNQERSVGVPKHNICFMQANGRIMMLNPDLSSDARDGILLLGKYQYVRQRLLTLLRFQVEDIADTANNYASKVFTSYDGKHTDAVNTPYVVTPVEDGLRDHLCDYTGVNHIIGLKGAFNANTVLITAILGAQR